MQQLSCHLTQPVVMMFPPDSLMASMQAFRILLVEDDDVDAEAVERGLRKHRIDCPVRSARDGAEALRLLRAERFGPNTTLPWIVLLDLNLAGMGGFEFLDALRADPALKRAVVMVLTSSNAARDRSEANRRGVAGYFAKADMEAGFSFLAKLLEQWPPGVDQ
ncbi:MAG: response regulator [Betaproteobacteria bacterium]|nr:response regulator [Betaproteobacteria bacterium]